MSKNLSTLPRMCVRADESERTKREKSCERSMWGDYSANNGIYKLLSCAAIVASHGSCVTNELFRIFGGGDMSRSKKDSKGGHSSSRIGEHFCRLDGKIGGWKEHYNIRGRRAVKRGAARHRRRIERHEIREEINKETDNA